jgi:hypothetical protein
MAGFTPFHPFYGAPDSHRFRNAPATRTAMRQPFDSGAKESSHICESFSKNSRAGQFQKSKNEIMTLTPFAFSGTIGRRAAMERCFLISESGRRPIPENVGKCKNAALCVYRTT